MIENTIVDVHMSIESEVVQPIVEEEVQLEVVEKEVIKLKPAAAILSLLKENSEGLSLKQIQFKLEGLVKTKSNNLNRLFYQTLKYLRSIKKVHLEEGSYFYTLEEKEDEVPQV